jgi:hypothetical protein
MFTGYDDICQRRSGFDQDKIGWFAIATRTNRLCFQKEERWGGWLIVALLKFVWACEIPNNYNTYMHEPQELICRQASDTYSREVDG